MRGFYTIVCLSIVCACGSTDSPPGPLSRHFDEMYIAAIPLDQKQSVLQTQQEWNAARMENANADAQLQELDSQLHQARNDQKASRLAIDSAISQKKSAEASADMNRINQSVKDLNTAEDLGKAADARVHYLQVFDGYLRRHLRWSQENMYWREAQFEQAKAQLAKTNNIAPKGIVYDAFPKQHEERMKRTQGAKQREESEKQRTSSAREDWLKLQNRADSENGHAGVYWDPMVTKGGTTTGAEFEAAREAARDQARTAQGRSQRHGRRRSKDTHWSPPRSLRMRHGSSSSMTSA